MKEDRRALDEYMTGVLAQADDTQSWVGRDDLIRKLTRAGYVAPSTGKPYVIGGRGILSAARACRKYLMRNGRLAEHAAVRRALRNNDGTRPDKLTEESVNNSNDSLVYVH